MKVRLVVAVLAAFFVLAGSAEAARWFVPYRLALDATKEFAAESCTSECIASAAGPCHRISQSRFDCVMIHFYPVLPASGAGVNQLEEVECHTLLHWGVNNYSGRVALKGTSRPYCF